MQTPSLPSLPRNSDESANTEDFYLQVAMANQIQTKREGTRICSHPACDEEISEARRKLGAIYCVDCQEIEEKKQKHFRVH